LSPVRVNYGRVRRMAAELLQGQTAPPVRLEPILAELGAEVRALELAADISGILYRDDDRKVIVVNASHTHERARFTIAHEIGHLVLHRGRDVHVDSSFRVNLRDPRSATAEDVEEIEANAFAANLLMPAAWLRAPLADHSIDAADGSETEALAERFQVSLQALIVRLTALSGREA
jgi:Zn-dependent peptidase ImmA (M78 family)